MDGVEATKLIKRSKEFKGQPIIALTANAMMGDREKYINEGLDDFMVKPIELEVMKSVLSKWSDK